MVNWYRVDHVGVAHEDTRRALAVPFNGEFPIQQIKVLTLKNDSILGNHYHRYRELFYILRNRQGRVPGVVYYLQNIKTGETAEVILKTGDRLIIEPFVAHAARLGRDVITIEASEESYVSPEHNDVHHEMISPILDKKKPGRKPRAK